MYMNVVRVHKCMHAGGRADVFTNLFIYLINVFTNLFDQ